MVELGRRSWGYFQTFFIQKVGPTNCLYNKSVPINCLLQKVGTEKLFYTKTRIRLFVYCFKMADLLVNLTSLQSFLACLEASNNHEISTHVKLRSQT